MNDHCPNQIATCGEYPIFRHYLSDIHCHVHCFLALFWSVALILIRGSAGIERQW